MIRKDVVIGLENGLEARPIAKLVQVATQFTCKLLIDYNGKQVDPRSLMGAMNLAAACGETFTVIADGEGETEAVSALEGYLSGRE